MHTLSAAYSESFQKKKLAMAKLFHEKPLQVSDKPVQLYSFSYNVSLCQKIQEEVVISILIHLISFFPRPPDFGCVAVVFGFPPVLIPSHITYISFSLLLLFVSCLFCFAST